MDATFTHFHSKAFHQLKKVTQTESGGLVHPVQFCARESKTEWWDEYVGPTKGKHVVPLEKEVEKSVQEREWNGLEKVWYE